MEDGCVSGPVSQSIRRNFLPRCMADGSCSLRFVPSFFSFSHQFSDLRFA